MGGGTGTPEDIPRLIDDIMNDEAVGRYYKSSKEADTVYRVKYIQERGKIVIRRPYSLAKGHERVDRSTTCALDACANDTRVHDFSPKRQESPVLVTAEADPLDSSIFLDDLPTGPPV